MDLHANAALSWSGRRELARRVLSMRDGRCGRRPRPPVSASAALASGLAAIGAAIGSCMIGRRLRAGSPIGRHPIGRRSSCRCVSCG